MTHLVWGRGVGQSQSCDTRITLPTDNTRSSKEELFFLPIRNVRNVLPSHGTSTLEPCPTGTSQTLLHPPATTGSGRGEGVGGG